MLEANEIIARAEASAGFADSEGHLHRNLQALLASLEADGRLSDQGRQSAERALIARTAQRLEGLRWVSDHPQIANEPIEAPIILTGLPRSGTTYLQYLFDRDGRFRMIRTWESLMPSPPPHADPASVAERKRREAEIRRQSRPEVEGFDALHLVDEDGPDECHAFMEQAGAAAGFFNLYDVPGYFDHLMGSLDFEAAYRVHRRQLQLLQWQGPARRWAVKYPNHLLAMPAIRAVYPGARFVMTHRDPVQLVASIANMTLALRSVRYDTVDPHRVGVQMRDFIRRHVDRILAEAKAEEDGGGQVVHVDYYRLVADPGPVLAEVHDRLGTGLPDEVRDAILGWRQANPKNARGSNDYTLEQFGLDRAELTDLFSDYCRAFDIPSERNGRARARARG